MKEKRATRDLATLERRKEELTERRRLDSELMRTQMLTQNHLQALHNATVRREGWQKYTSTEPPAVSNFWRSTVRVPVACDGKLRHRMTRCTSLLASMCIC